MTTANLTDLTSATLAAVCGINTHFKDSSQYQTIGGAADPNAETVVGALGVKVFRERLALNTAQDQALDSTPLAGLKMYAAAADINDDEATIRAIIHTLATDTRHLRISHLTGANEANSGYDGTGGSGSTHWYDQAVWQQYIIWDQVQIEVGAGNWTSGNRPKVVGCTLQRAGSGESEADYDADLAHLAAATWTTAGITYHMADVCDFGDFHWYSGWTGPGNRMDGLDSNGDLPAGITLGTDGLVSQEVYEIQRARQVYDSMLTGGTGALVSGHWKYTGGTVTTGHGATFAMCHSEWGTPMDDESGHDADSWQARGAVYGPETFLRDYELGLPMSCGYQALVGPYADGNRLGWYGLPNYPTGALPIYTAVDTLLGYSGSTTFVGVGAFVDIGGHLPDCTGYAFSTGTTGHWDLYLLREADTVAHLQLDVAHVVSGGTLTAGYYEVDLADTLTVVHVVPASGGGGSAPTWTDTTLPNTTYTGSYSNGVAATGTPTPTYSVTVGSLPPGLTLNSGTGTVTGTTTAFGTYPFTIRAHNTAGDADASFTMIVAENPAFTASSPPGATKGTSYEYDFAATSYPAATFAIATGSLNAGLTLSPNGVLSGTPSATGTSTFTVSAQNGIGVGGVTTGTLHITVASGGGGGTVPVFTADDPPDGQVGVAYSYQFTADGGTDDPTFSVASGTLPLGLVLASNGKLSGTPTVAADYTFVVEASNSAGSTDTPSLEVDVIDNGKHGSGQTFAVALSGPNSAFSVYAQVWESFLDDSSSARMFVVEDVNKTPIFTVRMKQSGKLDIDDVNGNSLAKGNANNIVTVGSDPSNRIRYSFVIGWNGPLARSSMILRVYGSDESAQYDDILTANVVSAEPYRVEIGNQSGKIYMTGDTVEVQSGASEIPAFQPEAVSQLFSFQGGANASGWLVNSRLAPGSTGKQVDLAVSATSDMASPVLVGAQTADGDCIVRHVVTGKSANTTYYAQLKSVSSGLLFGDVMTAKTLPATSGAWTRKIALVSCLNNFGGGASPQLAWSDILAAGVDDVWHLGDWGYWGQSIDMNDPYTKDLQKYDKAQANYSAERAALHTALMDAITISDHEVHVNGDYWDGTTLQDPTGSFNCPHTVREMTAFTALMPIRTYLDTRVPKRHRAYYFDIGAQVRVIVSDFRSPDRSNAADPESSSKTMFGAVQRADLRAAHDPSKFLLFVNETSNWDGSIGALRATDKPAAYQTDNEDWVAFWNATGLYAGGHNYAANMAWLGGDRHLCGYLSAANNTFGHFLQIISSGLFKNALSLQTGEHYDWQTFVPANTIDKFNVCQWVLLTLSFDGSHTVSLQANGRVGNTLRQVSDGVTTVGSVTISSATAAFVSSDIGQLIAGDGIENHFTNSTGEHDSPTFIASVAGDGLSATITQPAISTQSAGSWTIQNDESVWTMSDYPGGSPIIDTFTV